MNIQVIAVHCGGTLPVAMELPTAGLNFVQQHALKFLPRSPSGVPELRALGKADGEVQFRFKVPADKISPDTLPELLTQWDAKFTEATLKRIAKTNAEERKVASAAGLWKGDGDKTDSTDPVGMRGQCNPDDARDFSEALATVPKKKVKVSTAQKRTPKPKLLESVIEASTAVNPITGEKTAIASATVRAVSTLRARELIALMGAAGQGGEDLVDPLDNARLQDGVSSSDSPASVDGVESSLPAVGTPSNTSTSGSDAPPWDDDSPPDFPREGTGTTYISDVSEVLGVLQAHKEGKSAGPRLIELSVAELKLLARGGAVSQAKDEGAGDGMPAAAGTAAEKPASLVTQMAAASDAGVVHVAAPSTDGTNVRLPFENCFSVDAGNSEPSPDGFDLFEGCDEPVFFEKHEHDWEPEVVPTTSIGGAPVQGIADARKPVEGLKSDSVQQHAAADWSGLCSFRLSSSTANGHSLILESGEIFEAMANLEVREPLVVSARWFLDACREDDVAVLHADRLATQTGWLKEQLQWRDTELMRWLGKTDLVSPVPATTDRRKRQKATRPAGWVQTGVGLAGLAQNISMDIALLDMTLLDIERAIAGMPSWAIDMTRHIRSFKQSDLDAGAGVQQGEPDTAFRDAWRAELQRIDNWSELLRPIKITRQIGLFGAVTDYKLLLRLEDVIERTRMWSAAPSQASRVLAVWLGFVLSLDHSSVALTWQGGSVAGELALEDLRDLVELAPAAGEIAPG